MTSSVCSIDEICQGYFIPPPLWLLDARQLEELRKKEALQKKGDDCAASSYQDACECIRLTSKCLVIDEETHNLVQERNGVV